MQGKRKGDEEAYEENNTLQQHSTETAGDDDVYFLNEDFFTKHVGDHWGVSRRQKECKSKKMERDKDVALSPMTVSQPQCSTVHGHATFSNVNQCEKKRPRTTANILPFSFVSEGTALLESKPCKNPKRPRGTGGS